MLASCHDSLFNDSQCLFYDKIYNFTPFDFKKLPRASFESSSISLYPMSAALHRSNHFKISEYFSRSMGQC